MPNYNDGTNTGTLRAYRADVNNYFPLPSGSNHWCRIASGNFTVSLPDGGPTQQIPEGASLVVIYRVHVPELPPQVRSPLQRFGDANGSDRPHTSGRAGIL